MGGKCSEEGSAWSLAQAAPRDLKGRGRFGGGTAGPQGQEASAGLPASLSFHHPGLRGVTHLWPDPGTAAAHHVPISIG